jgi:EF-P beta-lysylation protein EpmB
MIAATSLSNQPHGRARWQQVLADAITDPNELLTMLGLDRSALAGSVAAAREFPLRVPRGFVARMRHGDPFDPLLLQVLPTAAELQPHAGYLTDPVGDLASRQVSGLLQKYAGRSLLIATGACAVHCRYCFRRHFPYGEESASSGAWQPALEHLARDPTVQEVILSGGDPLSLSDRRLAQLTTELQKLPHIRRIRIHTRQPVVLPERVDTGLLEWLNGVRLQKVIVLHVNHAREIDATVVQACRDLASTGSTLLNQSVLLAGVNDSAAALADLSEALIAAGVLPYYLHVLDRVSGASHFDVQESVACGLIEQLVARVPGYLVPKLVREIPGMPSKTPVTKST